MTEQEMDDFLESIDGLKNGFVTDAKPIKSCLFFATGKGWYSIIKKLIEDLIALGWDKQVCQVKEKFGGLRFYINAGSKEMHKLIDKAETKSLVTCEHCGLPGDQKNRGSWIITSCDVCWHERFPKEGEI